MFKSFVPSFLSSLFFGALVLSGCGSELAPGSASVLDRTSKPLSLGSVLELNGSYDPACLQRGGQSWSLGLNDFQSLTHAPLSVVLSDAGCTLYVTSFRLGTLEASQLYMPPSALQLTDSFFAMGVAFRAEPMAPVAFYANLRILPDVSFQGPFTVQAVYSEDVQATSVQLSPTAFSSVSAQLTAGGVPAPDYVASFADLAFQVDAQAVVQSVSGFATLGPQNVMGQSYVVDTGQLSANPTYGELDAAYLSGAPMPLSGGGMIPAEAFALAGQSLATPVVRNLIVVNEAAGTRSYQLIRITFAQ